MANRTPADIARETLKRLATRRLTPTPENYQAIYEEVAGLLPQERFPQASLRRIATVLPTQTATQKRISESFSSAVEAQDWTALQSAIADYAQLDLGLAPQTLEAALPIATSPVSVVPEGLAQELCLLIESTTAALGAEDQRMRDLSEQLVNFLRVGPPPLAALEQMLHNYSYRLSFTAEDQAQRQHSIHALLRMVCEHIATVAKHDQSLQQHAQALSGSMENLWTLQQLDIIQTHLKNLLFRHLELEGHRDEMQDQLKDLLTQHAQQMQSLGTLSEKHAQKLQDCATQIQATHDLGDLTQTLETVVQSGSALATENRMVQAQLADLRSQTQAQEKAIAEMSAHISALTESTRHDSQTGALNLDGLHETLRSETARLYRTRNQPTHTISLAALEIDHFDQLPASIQGAALAHLARITRSTLRPQDNLGRVTPHGFVVVFPGTEPSEAAQALARLQTELNQSPLHDDDQKFNLNFCAGVVAARPDAPPSESFARAAAACEQAQHMGTARISIQ